MGEPLSVAASIVGLLTAAAKASQVIADVVKRAGNAPGACERLKSQIDDFRGILSHLQLYVCGASKPHRSRRSLIMIDQIVTTLVACVQTFSELDNFVKVLDTDEKSGVLDRLRWISKEEELSKIVSQLQMHKASLILMLTILTCQKQDDAEDKVDQLCELVKETLNQNDILAKRLATYESVTLIEQKAKTVQLNASYSKRIAGSLASSRQSIDEAHTQSDLDSLAVLEDDRYNDMVASGVEDSTVPTIQDNSYGFDFEGLLMDSRVYRRATLDNDDPFSVFSTAECTGTWSKLSGISLSEISNIAVLALPLYAKDVNNWEAYQLHQPGNEPAMSGAGTSTISHTSLEISRSIGSPKQWLRPFNLGRKYGNHLQATGRRIPQIFGSPLIHSTRCAKVLIIFIDDKSNVFELGSIPLVVAKTCTHLKSQGSRADDAFVTKGQHARISDLENIFCKSPKYGRNIDWTGYTIYDAASLLLRYFRSLPEPIIPQRYYQRFVQLFRRCVNSEGNKGDLRMSAPVHTMTVDKIRSYIRQLPPLNRRLLLYVLDLLAFFAGDSKERGLARAKIISIFQPALLTLETVKMDTVEQRLATEAIEAMVESHAHFLPNLCQRLLGTAESRQNLKSLGYRGLVQLNEAVKVKDMFLRPGLL